MLRKLLSNCCEEALVAYFLALPLCRSTISVSTVLLRLAKVRKALKQECGICLVHATRTEMILFHTYMYRSYNCDRYCLQ